MLDKFHQGYIHGHLKAIFMKQESGFTLVELMIAIGVTAIVMAFAVPGVLGWMPDYHLKGAANDLFSNLQWAKLNAVKENKDWAVVFDTANGRYYICSDGGADSDWSTVIGAGANTVERTVNFAQYDSGVGYGSGSAITNATTGGGALPGDNVSHACTDLCEPDENNVVVFNSRGTSEEGYVYLDNNNNSLSFAVGTRVSGVISMLRWTGAAWN